MCHISAWHVLLNFVLITKSPRRRVHHVNRQRFVISVNWNRRLVPNAGEVRLLRMGSWFLSRLRLASIDPSSTCGAFTYTSISGVDEAGRLE